MKTFRPGDPGYDDLPSIEEPSNIREERKNPVLRGADQFGRGIEEGLIGISKGISDLGVGTGTVFGNEGLRKKSEELSQYFQKKIEAPHLQQGREVMQGWTRPVEKSLRLVGNALPSLGSAMVGGVAGRKLGANLVAKGMFKSSPKLAPKIAGYLGSFTGSIPLGASIAGSYWSEGVEAGKDPTDKGHYALAITDGVVQSILETLPIMGWMKGGRLGKRVARGFLQEGTEEVTQQFFENALKIYGWKGTDNLYKDMVTGIADNFVAGALTGGLMGTIPGMNVSKADQIHDLSNNMAKVTFDKMTKDGATGKDGLPVTLNEVRTATRALVNEVDNLDNIILPKLMAELEKRVKGTSELTATGKHEAVERSKVIEGELVVTHDDSFSVEPLDKGADAEVKRKTRILELYEQLQYKIFGRLTKWSAIPEMIRWNVLNDPNINPLTATLDTIKKSLDGEMDKYVVHVPGNKSFTSPKDTVFFGPLRNMRQDWSSGGEHSKEAPEIHGEIWLEHLPRKLKEMGIHPHDVEFVGKGAENANKIFLSEYATSIGTAEVGKVTKRREVNPKEYSKSAISRSLDRASDKLDSNSEQQQSSVDDETETAYGKQWEYVAHVHSAVKKAWADIQALSGNIPSEDSTQLLKYLINKKPLKVKGEGLQIRSLEDLAEIFSIFRNPRIEITQAVFIKDGVVLDHEAVSLGAPDRGNVAITAIDKKAKKLGAQYYLIHNHPSGNVNASNQDMIAHATFKEYGGENFLGQVILDHNSFGHINVAGEHQSSRYKSGKTFFHKGATKMPASMKKLGEFLNSNWRKGKVTLILTDDQFVQSIHYLTQKDLPKKIAKLMKDELSPFYYLGVEGDTNDSDNVFPEGIIGLTIKKPDGTATYTAAKDLKIGEDVWTKITDAQKKQGQIKVAFEHSKNRSKSDENKLSRFFTKKGKVKEADKQTGYYDPAVLKSMLRVQDEGKVRQQVTTTTWEDIKGEKHTRNIITPITPQSKTSKPSKTKEQLKKERAKITKMKMQGVSQEQLAEELERQQLSDPKSSYIDREIMGLKELLFDLERLNQFAPKELQETMKLTNESDIAKLKEQILKLEDDRRKHPDGGIGEDFVQDTLFVANQTVDGKGKPGLSVEQNGVQEEFKIEEHYSVVYRDPKGKAVMVVEVGENKVDRMALDKTRGLLSGRALGAVIKELEKRNITAPDIRDPVSKEAWDMYGKYKGDDSTYKAKHVASGDVLNLSKPTSAWSKARGKLGVKAEGTAIVKKIDDGPDDMGETVQDTEEERFVKRFINTGKEALDWLLTDKNTQNNMNMNEGTRIINSFAMIDMLNELWDSGSLGQGQAMGIHQKLMEILNDELIRKDPLTLFKKGKKVKDLTSKQAEKQLESIGELSENIETVEDIRSWLWHMNQSMDIQSIAVKDSQTQKDFQKGATVKQAASPYLFDSYRIMRNMVNYYGILTGKSKEFISNHFKLNVKDISGQSGRPITIKPAEQLEKGTPISLIAKSPYVKPLTAAEKKAGKKQSNPWYMVTGYDNGVFTGVIPQLEAMLEKEGKKPGVTKQMIENSSVAKKIKQLKEIVKWLEEGGGEPTLPPKTLRSDYNTDEEFNIAKMARGDEVQRLVDNKFKGLPQLRDQFLKEQTNAVKTFLDKVEGVYMATAHMRLGLDGKDFRVEAGAYSILRNPKNKWEVKLDTEPERLSGFGDMWSYDHSKTATPAFNLINLRTETVAKKTKDGKPIKTKVKTKAGWKIVTQTMQTSYNDSITYFTQAEIDESLKHGINPGVMLPGPDLAKIAFKNDAMYEKEKEDNVKRWLSERSSFKSQMTEKEKAEWKEQVREEKAARHEAQLEDMRGVDKGKIITRAGEEALDVTPTEEQEKAKPNLVSELFHSKLLKKVEQNQAEDEAWDEEFGDVDVGAPRNSTFDGEATIIKKVDSEEEVEHFSEPAKYEATKLKVYKKVINFFTGNEDATMKFLGDWVKGGNDKIKEWQGQVEPASQSVMDEVIKTAIKDKNYIKLAQLKGFQVQDLIRQEIQKEMESMYPGLSARAQNDKALEWLKYMNDAAEEIVHIPGNTYRHGYSDKGIGGPWMPGMSLDNVHAERDANVARLTEMYKLKNGKEPSADLKKAWNRARPTAAFYNMLTPRMQSIILWNKSNVEDPIFFNAAIDVLIRADNIDNRRAGYSPRMFTEDLNAEAPLGGVQQSIGTQRVAPRKYRTFAEFAAETKGHVEPVDNYAASAGWYTKNYLIRIHQHSIIEQFKGIRNDGAYDIGIITYLSDGEVIRLSDKFGMTPAQFLATQGYDEVKNAEGLTTHWRGTFLRPWVHRSAKHAIDRFYIQPGQNSKSMSSINWLNGLAKRLIMMMPHQFALQITSSSWLWYNSPQEVWEHGIQPMFNPFKIAQGMKKGMERMKTPFAGIDKEYDHRKLDLFIKNGLRAINQNWMQKAIFDSRAAVKHPLDRNSRENLGEFISGKAGLDNYIFEQYMSKAIFRYASAMMDRFKKVNPNMSEEELASMAVKFVNDTSGTLPSYVYGQEGQFLQFFLFARDFTINFDRQITGAIYQFLPKSMQEGYKIRPGAGMILNPFLHAESTSKQMQFLSPWYGKHLLKTSAIKIGLFMLLQSILWNAFADDEDKEKNPEDQWMFHNEPGKKAMMKMPWKDVSGHDEYLDPIIWRELSQFLSLMPESTTLGKGPVAVAQSKMSATLKMALDTYINEDYLGLPIRDPGGDPIKNAGKQALYYIKQITPAAFKAQPKEIGKNPWAKASLATGFPLKRSSFPTGTDIKEMEDFRKRQASQVFRRGDTRRDVIYADEDTLRDMLIAGKISRQVFKNELLRRRDPRQYFMRNTYKGLIRDENKQ